MSLQHDLPLKPPTDTQSLIDLPHTLLTRDKIENGVHARVGDEMDLLNTLDKPLRRVIDVNKARLGVGVQGNLNWRSGPLPRSVEYRHNERRPDRPLSSVDQCRPQDHHIKYIGSPVNKPETYLSAIQTKHIDVVLDVAGADACSHKFLNDLAVIGLERLDADQSRGVKGPKLGFIYCSGTWVHGSSNGPVNDLDPVGKDAQTPPEEQVIWRVEMEKAVLQVWAENGNDLLFCQLCCFAGASSDAVDRVLTRLNELVGNLAAEVARGAEDENFWHGLAAGASQFGSLVW